jgi:hypothetical protein
MTPSSFTPPVIPFSNEPSVLDFKTQDAWTAYDLGRALTALDSLYSSFLLARHLAVIANQRLRRAEEQLGRYWEILEREGPHFDMPFHEWSRFLRRYGPTAAQFLSPFGSVQAQAVDHINQLLPPAEVDYYLSNPSEYLSSDDELKLRNIAIASPGGFSLEGLGEPIRELREFIKDMCYRNRQEREKGNLEILKQKLDIISQHNLSPLHIQIIAKSAILDVEEVARVMHDGHLQLEASDSAPSKEGRARKKTMKKSKPWQL